LNLEKGLTVFTGPNGSGKSNLFDAIKFVLGDLSARSLRASKMGEIIFDGVLGTPSAKTAYVKLRFDNSDRTIPLDRDVVTLSRRVNRKGISKYLLNGSTVSRSQLIDVLGMAKLYSSGHNMIMQGTITKLAEITPDERRRVIEDFVGIAEYNAKKAEARMQLRQAETNLRIADARIGDVQYRLERLEEERNDALRFNVIQGEIRKLHAILTSHLISQIEAERKSLTEELEQQGSEVENLKVQRNDLQQKRREVESARRRFDEEVTDKGSVRLHAIQQRIGEIMASIASLKMEIDSGNISLKGLNKIRDERALQLKSLQDEVRESTSQLSTLRAERNKVKQELDEKAGKQAKLSTVIGDLKQNLGKNTSRIRELETEYTELERQATQVDTQLKRNTVKQRIIANNLKNLEERCASFNLMVNNLEVHLSELQRLQKEERERGTRRSTSLDKALTKKNELLLEMEDAEKTATIARNAIVDFKARKEFIDKIATEESALQRLEEMGKTGAIQGIIGRLSNLVKIKSKYRRALDVTASGWLNALVVKDIEVALRCAESLKKMKIGRIKLLPLGEVKDAQGRDPVDLDGVIGLAAELVQCDEKYLGAVNFVFGDTAVTSGKKSAFLASKKGVRAVDLNGDLYEAGGGIESGYYRVPIDITSLIPREIAIGGLTKSVQSLERVLSKRKKDVDDITSDIAELHEEQVKRLEVGNIIARDIDLVSNNISRTKQNIKTLNKRVKRLKIYLSKGDQIQSQLRSKRDTYTKSLRQLQLQKKKIAFIEDQSSITQYEDEETRLQSEITEANRRFVRIESDVNFLETKLRATLKPEHERVKLDIQTLTKQINKMTKNTTTAQSSLDVAEKQLADLEGTKAVLSESLASVKGKRGEFEEQVDKIDLQLKRVGQEYEPLTNRIHQLELELQRKNLESEGLRNELLRLGREKPVSAILSGREVKNVEASLDLMRFELEQLGSVNQLAPDQYNEQQKNYKQLSVRRNQLERERRAILEFIDEVERKKREAFIEAYMRVNESFTVFFEKLTGGGKGRLSLEKAEDPFAGGLDIFVQFPGKASRLIAGASGGEKSVVAVAFVFAIQSLSPASFYMFDEVDAHLDPYNAERLADLLKEQSVNSQFIVVTLRDVVIDRAEKLFGVYIQNGLSHVISTRMEEAVAQLA
jgi:chromosome segregation protein